MDFNKEYIALIIKNARKKRGLKQSQLSELVGISEKHLSKIETGRNYPALDNFLRIVKVLNLTLKDFGIDDKGNFSENKELLHKIINTSTEKQLNIYADIIGAIRKHF